MEGLVSLNSQVTAPIDSLVDQQCQVYVKSWDLVRTSMDLVNRYRQYLPHRRRETCER